jgi:hypothetical protein
MNAEHKDEHDAREERRERVADEGKGTGDLVDAPVIRR